MKQEEIAKLFPAHIRQALLAAHFDMDQVYEIRLRVNAPLIVIYQGQEYFLTREGEFSREESQGCFVRAEDLKETMEYVSSYSMYAFEEEIRQGFITIQGGHRVGIAGKTVLEGDRIKSVKYISYINLRLSHQIKGCASPILPYIIKNGRICHTLIISPPRCGKTTLLRDLIRQVSSGSSYMPGVSVGVVDERSEIGGSYQGIPQNDLGIRTDVLDCCPKAEGMMMLIRSMSPEVVAVDELGDYEDIHAIESVIHCGCKLFATVHGSSIEDIKRKPLMQRLVRERIFERYIVLHHQDRAGRVKAIFDERGTSLFDWKRKQGILC
ncbi:MAG TPA: stage III sporulation protein AA [Candidatus Blautia stercorigallinarum]|uniref:Stage III sporulation protein AA n=1 Tax=Candidatus Blautia stercorigallinarum TaxID=2838501 RepID=A0A9D1PDG5_9FIRM|nr:stage III sporulation protein AA [Candidatus Blautia stercorigallinarum]